jgi:predicted phage terminase large subunit-like protein
VSLVLKECPDCKKVVKVHNTTGVCQPCTTDRVTRKLKAAQEARLAKQIQRKAKKVAVKRVARMRETLAPKVKKAVEAEAKALIAPEREEIEKHKKQLDKYIEKNNKARTAQIRHIAREERNNERAVEAIATGTEIERELARRELCRRKMIHFTQRFTPGYQTGWLHREISEELEKFLEKIVKGESPRQMLFVPPRHGKSELVSRKFPAYSLGHYPWMEFISASYDLSLPLEFSRHVRALLRDPYYRLLFPRTNLDPENQNAEGWKTTRRGGFLPAGVRGPITGKGAHVLNIDDPVKSSDEADSETLRASAWGWYGSTALSRLAPQSGVLITMTRWHDADLAGMALQTMFDQLRECDEMVQNWRNERVSEAKIEEMLAQMHREMDMWNVIKYPAVAEEDEPNRKKGEALHPARYPIDRLKRMKNSGMLPRHWSALYQQNPIPEEGLYFKKENIRQDSPPEWRECPIRIAFDLAIGQKQSNDYTVGTVCALDGSNRIHVLEMVRGRWDTDDICRAVLDLYTKYWTPTGDIIVGIEKGQLELAIKPSLYKMMDERKVWPAFDDTLKPITDKMVRARPLQGVAQRGLLIFPNTPWADVAINELLRFPGGMNDDIVDSLAWAVRMLTRTAAPRPKIGKQPKGWKDKLAAMTGRTGSGAMAA